MLGRSVLSRKIGKFLSKNNAKTQNIRDSELSSNESVGGRPGNGKGGIIESSRVDSRVEKFSVPQEVLRSWTEAGSRRWNCIVSVKVKSDGRKRRVTYDGQVQPHSVVVSPANKPPGNGKGGDHRRRNSG